MDGLNSILFSLIGIVSGILPLVIIIVIIVIASGNKKQNKERAQKEYDEYTKKYQNTVYLDSNGKLKYPPYNEKVYIRKAKQRDSGNFESLRDQCMDFGFALASTVIGIVICWIPFLIAIITYPYAIYKRRKLAYQIYVEDCEELKRQYYKNK